MGAWLDDPHILLAFLPFSLSLPFSLYLLFNPSVLVQFPSFWSEVWGLGYHPRKFLKFYIVVGVLVIFGTFLRYVKLIFLSMVSWQENIKNYLFLANAWGGRAICLSAWAFAHLVHMVKVAQLNCLSVTADVNIEAGAKHIITDTLSRKYINRWLRHVLFPSSLSLFILWMRGCIRILETEDVNVELYLYK